jgi:hypothetical protein
MAGFTVGNASSKALAAKGGQQLFHRFDPWAKQAGQATAAGEGLNRCARVEPQRLEQSPKPAWVGQHLQEQLTKTDLPAAAQFGVVEFRSRGFDQLVVTDARRDMP